ncbi:MAG: Ig-like domain-containing protein, partial [Planctomycetes bacterium]|nr:Ig-like domain-containing protein [Planctomycetota bacterium]
WYHFHAKAMDTSDNLSAASASVSARAFDDVPPGTPTNFAPTAGDARINCTWAGNVESDVKVYRLLRGTSAQGPFSVLADVVATTSHVDLTVVVDTEYFYKLLAIDTSDNESPVAAGPVSATAFDHTPPAVPSSGSLTPAELSLVVTWLANATDPDYAGTNVYRSATEVGGYQKRNDAPVTGTQFTDADDASLTPVWIVLRSVDTHGNESAPTSPCSATPLNTLPPASPVGVGVSPGDSRNTITWQHGSEVDLAGVDVLRSTSPDSGFAKVNTVPVTGTSYLDLSLENYTTYWYRLEAVDVAQHASEPSSPAVAGQPIDLTPPPVPGALAVAPLNRRAVLTLPVVGAADLAGLNVYRGTQAQGPWEKVNVTPVTALTFTDTGLQNGVAYLWQARAIDVHDNESGPSAIAGATPRYTRPTGLTRAAVGNRSVSLVWNPVDEPDLAGTRAFRGPEAAGPWTLLTPTLVTGAAFTDADVPNGTWWYAVAAVATNVEVSPLSDPVLARPEALPPPTLNAAAGPTADNTPRLTGAGIRGYLVRIREGTTLRGEGTVGAQQTFAIDLGAALDDGEHTLVATQTSPIEGGASSEPSEEAVVTVNTVPTALAARATSEHVAVSWARNALSAMTHHVYRTTTPGSGYVRLTSAPIADCLLLDSGMPSGTYFYRVAAVNALGHEGALSEEVEAVFDVTPPLLVSVAPAQLAEGVAVDAQVRLTFSEDLAKSTAGYGQGLFLVDAGRVRLVDATVSWEGPVATIAPAQPFDHDAVYEVAVTPIPEGRSARR